MKRNELILKLRLDFNNHIRDNYMKDVCEECGSNENLHVHHIITFISQLEYILKLMNISSKEEFSDNEVELIRLAMYGSQYKNNHYMTLCQSCHIDRHLELKYDSKKKKKNVYKSYLNGSLKILLDDKYLNKYMNKDGMYKLILKYDMKNRDGGLMGLRAFIQILRNSNYEVTSKRKRVKGQLSTYYIIKDSK